MAYGLGTDNIGINFFGGFKINAMENTATFSIGDVNLSNISSQSKSILFNQVFGDYDMINQQALNSAIIDPDVYDNFKPMNQNDLGLED